MVLEGTATKTTASMISSTEVSCEIPPSPVAWGTPATHISHPVYGMMIAISNDGQHLSDSLFFTVYDSTCQQCMPNGVCWKKVRHWLLYM